MRLSIYIDEPDRADRWARDPDGGAWMQMGAGPWTPANDYNGYLCSRYIQAHIRRTGRGALIARAEAWAA